MRYTLFIFNIIILTSVSTIEIVKADKKPVKPNSIKYDAKWKERAKVWSYKDSLIGNYYVWNKDGSIKSKTIVIKKNKLRKEINYYKNGTIKSKGQEIFDNNQIEPHTGELVGWIVFGKWKNYNKSGNLTNEYCLTPYLINDYWEVGKCSKEIEYSESGKIIKTFDHKRKCKYGCEEVK